MKYQPRLAAGRPAKPGNRDQRVCTPHRRGRLDYWEKREEPPCPFSGAAEAAEWRRGYLEARREAEE